MKNIFNGSLLILKENLNNFYRTIEMAKKELQKKYSGAALGTLWALVKPLIFIFVYWFAISVGIRGGKPVGNFPYILWLIAGIIPWFYFVETLIFAGTSIRSNRHLVTKMVYPVGTIPTFRVLSQLFIHIILSIICTLIFVIAGYGPTIYFLQLFYYIICSFVFMWFLSWITSALVVISRDFEHLLKSITQMLFWVTPIIWSIDSINGFVRYIFFLNPMYYIVRGFRNTFLYQVWFFEEPYYMIYFWGSMFFLSILGGHIFNKLRKEFADVL